MNENRAHSLPVGYRSIAFMNINELSAAAATATCVNVLIAMLADSEAWGLKIYKLNALFAAYILRSLCTVCGILKGLIQSTTVLVQMHCNLAKLQHAISVRKQLCRDNGT